MSKKPPKKMSKVALYTYLGLFIIMAVVGVTVKGNMGFLFFVAAIGVIVAMVTHMQKLDQPHRKTKKS